MTMTRRQETTAWWRDPLPRETRTADERDQDRLWWQTYLWLGVNGYLRCVPQTVAVAHTADLVAIPVTDGLVSQTDAARLVGCHRVSLTRALRKGELQGLTFPGSKRRLLRLSDVRHWQMSRRKMPWRVRAPESVVTT